MFGFKNKILVSLLVTLFVYIKSLYLFQLLYIDYHGSCVYSQGKFKKMVGSLGGSEEKVKMEHFDTLVGIGKQKIVVDGTGALRYLVKLMKTPSILRFISIWFR